MRSKDVLKEALMNYDGTLIIVSHDRDFLSGLVPMIQEVTPNGLKEFRGDIFDFLKEKKASSIAEFERSGAEPSPKKKEEKEESSNPQLDYKERKELEKQRRKLKNAVGSFERKIEEAESTIEEMTAKMATLDYSDQEKAQAFVDEFDKKKAELEQMMEDWAAAEEELLKVDAILDQDGR
jgi:ATP-binding cassette subfamily F protein 3